MPGCNRNELQHNGFDRQGIQLHVYATGVFEIRKATTMKNYSIQRNGVNSTESNIRPMLMLTSFWEHRELLRELVKRDIMNRYQGSFGGACWSFAYPLFMLGVYTLVFGTFFRMRWGGAGSTLEFSLVLFSGLIIFNFFSECLNRAPGLVAGQPNYVKKVVFPLEIYPWVAVGSAFFNAVVSFAAWMIFYGILHGAPSASLLLLPLVVAPLIPVVLGLGWILSSIGVYVRDIAQVVGIATQALMFLSPVFFSLDAVPEKLRGLMLLNPLTFIMVEARRVMLQGELPDFSGLAVYLLAALIFSWAGFALFQKLRDGFSDVI